MLKFFEVNISPCYNNAMTKIRQFGDQAFRLFLKEELAVLTSESARDVLAFIVNLINMPTDLSGELLETQHLLTYFDELLSPHDEIWRELALITNIAFPEKSLSEKTDLARAVHQLRYVISSQQAEYVRRFFKNKGASDADALALYLKDKSFTLRESSRLHNKVKRLDEKIVFPDNQVSYNIKILINFHTEFILDSYGNFLNEVDAQKVTEAGVVNGASFNYSRKNDIRHKELDIRPTVSHDPLFRKIICEGYTAPELKKYRHQPFMNAKSIFQLVKRESMSFKQLVKKSKRWI